MILSEILNQKSVICLPNVTSKKRLFQEIANHFSKFISVGAEPITLGLQEREQLGPTGMGHGVAIPHAKIQSLLKIHGVFLKLEKPLDFESMDKQPVDLIFTLIAPTDHGAEHLKALAKVSRILRDPQVRVKLRSTEDNAAIYSILTQDIDIEAA